MREKKEATITHAFISIIFMVASLAVAILKFQMAPHIPVVASVAVAASIGYFMLGYSWTEMEKSMIKAIQLGMPSILILFIIGMVIGLWILSGTVPTMIYYGLKILSPDIFLVATCLICCVVSVATGSSWTTAGTVGVALIGIGQGLGIDLEMVAGAIVSGAYFGDKMSLLSDTTNLAPAVAETTIFEHIRSMIYTTGPSLLVTLIVFGILGLQFSGKELDMTTINSILDTLDSSYHVSPVLLIPPVVVIIIVILKVPALPGILLGAFLGAIFASAFQGAGLGEIISASHTGVVSQTGVETVDNLLSRGGLNAMLWSASLVIIALCYGGVMEKTGMMKALANAILKMGQSSGSLILSTILTGISINLFIGDQYMAIVLPGRMYKKRYKEMNLHPRVLSRTLEDGGTLVSPVIPWNSCGAYMSTTLGVSAFAYFPYAVFNIVNPVIAVLLAYMGIGQFKLKEEADNSVAMLSARSKESAPAGSQSK